MEKSAYIERICRELSQQSPQEEAAHNAYLLDIFDHVKQLASPEKEDTLVQMLTSWHLSHRNPDAPQAAA
jgi:hypothetical protein